MYPSTKIKSHREKKRRLVLTKKLNELSDQVFKLHPELLNYDGSSVDDKKRCSVAYLKQKNINRTELLKLTSDLLLKFHTKCKAKGETISQLRRMESASLSMKKKRSARGWGVPIQNSFREESSAENLTSVTVSASCDLPYQFCPDATSEEGNEIPIQTSLPDEPSAENLKSHVVSISSDSSYQLFPDATSDELLRRLTGRSVSAILPFTSQISALRNLHRQNVTLLTTLSQRNAESQRLESVGMSHLLRNNSLEETSSLSYLNMGALENPFYPFLDDPRSL
eukprot:CAMPEP_0194222240 /NCGR_PEP_ID=MMETSP0156-20130528/32451_1 /TAXON_ID=33649 /ORGANISM="Thalassionema nitzschioides, Strain L26-B" /LENGTH=281 /DNA_ID=CAMNT_0038952943 /DNA_START=89 /DNA_END=934 /DNA_ORIENTATION=+